MKRILLLNKSRIKDLDNLYLATILNSQINKLPINGDPIRLEMKYKKGEKTYLLFRLDNKKFCNIKELLKVIRHQLNIEDPNLKYDKIYISFKPIQDEKGV
jgi:hypothetical protein